MKTDNITSFVLGILCFFGFLTAYAELNTSEAPLNLLSNGSFEEGAYSPTESPIDWAWDAWQPSAIFTWDNTQARTGDKSVNIYAPTSNDARWIQSVDVEPNTLYFLSGWIKTDNVGHSSEPVDAGANLSLFGTWEHSAGVFGSQDWTRNSILFNSGDGIQVTVGARLGYWAGTTTGTAWFDDLQLKPIVPMDPHPSWKLLILIYQETDFEVTDDSGIYHHYVASMTQDEMEQAALIAKQFVEIDIPALTSENMVPELTVRFPDRALTRLSPIAQGWWPSPEDTASERDPQFDSVIVIWDTRAIDLTTGAYKWIGYGDGLAAYMGTGQTYNTMQIDAAISRGHRNVFKHEWGHSILFYYDAVGTSPKPTVSNHADATQYVNCLTGQFYVWEDETLANPIPNSIYNNESGFTHDYYSGNTATADQPARCLGIPPEAWALGGPVSHSGNMYFNTDEIDVDIDIKPGNKRNVINPRAKGGIWVAVLSDTDTESPFDPLSQVDIPTVEFGPDDAKANRYKVKDINRDGLGDLLLRFKIPETGISCGDTEATLIGETLDGQSFTGTDFIKTVGCPKQVIPETAIQNPDNGHWYQRFDSTMTWHDAKTFCEGLGGHIATLTSSVENDFVYDYLVVSAPRDRIWLGATDEVEEGVWRWITGEDWDILSWPSGEPNNCAGIEHYLTFYGQPYLWNDLGSCENPAGEGGGAGCGGCPEDWESMSTICEWDSKKLTKHHKKYHVDDKKYQMMQHKKHHGDNRDDDKRHHGMHKEEKKNNKHHDDDHDEGHKKR